MDGCFICVLTQAEYARRDRDPLFVGNWFRVLLRRRTVAAGRSGDYYGVVRRFCDYLWQRKK